MRSSRTTTLLAIAIPLFVLGAMGVASDVSQDRSFFMPNALMWRVNWSSYTCVLLGSLLLLFAFTRFIVRLFRR
ncbi:MAG: hypothetical protein DME22_08770 [Verrucomicrobia bacterium]|nr:MAG: hypothetical protein DME22_08770 [Verrucomicrobiota bacterium]PYJ96298.1 MAG: hypothetical protein DME23_21240 [Verrucomicrobiota bacterium]